MTLNAKSRCSCNEAVGYTLESNYRYNPHMIAQLLEPLHQMNYIQRLLVLSVLTVIYILAGILGLQLAFLHPSATPVWPPSGISLAAFLLLGYQVWPAILVGAVIVNATTVWSLSAAFGIATGNVLEGLLGAYLINHYANGLGLFSRQRDTLMFVLLAALLSTTVSATFGVTSLALTGYADWAKYTEIWITWWLGDAGGALIVTPAIVLWLLDHTIKWSRGQSIEFGITTFFLGLVTWIVFQSPQAMTGPHYPLGFLTLSVLIWIAVRFEPRETATAILLTVGIAIWGTLRGSGPFTVSNPNESLLLLQAFMALITVTALGLSVSAREQKHAELALNELNKTLERRIQDRTSTLQSTVEQLKECDCLKNAFVGIVSHELRTPVTSIKIFAQNLFDCFDGQLNEKQQHYVSRIQYNADRLSRMLNELLDLSKIQEGVLEVHPTVLSVQEIANDLWEAFQPLAQQKSISMNMANMTHLPKVYGDRDKLYEIFGNLLENAIKFTQAGGHVEIGAQVLDDLYIKVHVSDTGCGISREHLPKIFDKFYRVTSSAVNVPGSGLGLSIAKGLVELHGGSITVESAPGQGSHFFVTLRSAA